jgi:hypothetical protein
MQRSEDIALLAAAFVKARPKFTAVKKTHTATVASSKGTYKYTYSTLDDLNDATVAVLADHGLVASQNINTTRELETVRGKQEETVQVTVVSVTTMLLHESGQFIQSDPVTLPGGSTPQSVGSAITYARRYSMQAALGIAAEEDDDGIAAASSRKPKAESKPQADAPPVAKPAGAVINDAQRTRLWTIAKTVGWSKPEVAKLLERYQFDSSRKITVDKYDEIVAKIETGEAA